MEKSNTHQDTTKHYLLPTEIIINLTVRMCNSDKSFDTIHILGLEF